jgi:hypothetical protein
VSLERALKTVAALTDSSQGALAGVNAVECLSAMGEEERTEALAAAIRMLLDAPEFKALAGMLSTWKIMDDLPLDQDLAVAIPVGPHKVTILMGYTDEAMEVLRGIE